MHSLFSGLILGLVFAVASGATTSTWVLHEKRSQIPTGWVQARKYAPTSPLPLRIALKQSTGMDEMATYLHDVSHPDSPNYGQHWTAEQVVERFAPGNDTIDAVRNWLVDSGIAPERVQLSPGKGWIRVLNATVAEAEDLLRAEYYVYTHESGIKNIATASYYLPAHMTPHVDLVLPTIHFDAKIPSTKNTASVNAVPPKARRDALCQTITPDCLRLLYGIPDKPTANKKNSFGIVAYAPESYRQKDLDMFAKQYATGLVGKSPKQVSIDGGKQIKNNGSLESSLDLEYAMSLVGPSQQVTLYQVGDAVEGANFNNFIDAIDAFYCMFEFDGTTADTPYPDRRPGGYKGAKQCGTAKPTDVISTSQGIPEHDISNFYAGRQCLEYGKLGIMGVTVIYPTGDHGVAGDGKCPHPKGHSKDEKFSVMFPASCPFVTAVGGTQLPFGAYSEVAWPGSGGGWSNYFGMPAYQSDAVKYYLKHHQHGYSSDIWNSTGKSRAIPDIALNAEGYRVAMNGKWVDVGGTSASAPVLGALVTLVNDARLKAGKKPVGFINPALYSKHFACALHDIISGTNPGCGKIGYKTAIGWDPVTGLGTPIYQQLVNAWLKLP
ncbi:peptidase S8/S53 domain-containing protein [Hygrophoropsis aurantiaca]|uniref:Peptidase S8/S53 domain-containing protein n=1 Tax=Hygrophoropsis aurantiaca TaxID=72124 RepID=A0ACB8AKV4_9AGAM|nr:peptidase S8/S53 domain-containing protein [Hygrophoropsis aurantiaca]